eukprot:m.22501 g.22501  ORF g.22501 m.22501 type:complete len:135 (-) comp7405_c0_seq3:87-491(-)
MTESRNNGCIFCAISAGETETDIEIENERVASFKDRSPASKHHFLVVPKVHIRDRRVLLQTDEELEKELAKVAKQLLDQHSISINDARVGYHTWPFVSINHVHLHVIAPANDLSLFGRFLYGNVPWFQQLEVKK